MKMIMIFAAVMSAGLVGCKKDSREYETAAPKASLRITTFFNSGATRQVEVDPSTLSGNSFIDITNDGSGDKVLLNLGAVSITPRHTLHGLSFIFHEADSYEGARGTFQFPGSSNLVRSLYREEVSPVTTENHLEPLAGQLYVQYNAILRTMSGRVENLEYTYNSNDLYGRLRTIINGEFFNIRESQ